MFTGQQCLLRIVKVRIRRGIHDHQLDGRIVQDILQRGKAPGPRVVVLYLLFASLPASRQLESRVCLYEGCMEYFSRKSVRKQRCADDSHKRKVRLIHKLKTPLSVAIHGTSEAGGAAAALDADLSAFVFLYFAASSK